MFVKYYNKIISKLKQSKTRVEKFVGKEYLSFNLYHDKIIQIIANQYPLN